jgi:hypothetical protein
MPGGGGMVFAVESDQDKVESIAKTLKSAVFIMGSLSAGGGKNERIGDHQAGFRS